MASSDNHRVSRIVLFSGTSPLCEEEEAENVIVNAKHFLASRFWLFIIIIKNLDSMFLVDLVSWSIIFSLLVVRVDPNSLTCPDLSDDYESLHLFALIFDRRLHILTIFLPVLQTFLENVYDKELTIWLEWKFLLFLCIFNLNHEFWLRKVEIP